MFMSIHVFLFSDKTWKKCHPSGNGVTPNILYIYRGNTPSI